MRKLKIAMAVIEQGDVYHLQFRDGPRSIGAAGMIGCFGGKIEEGETPLQAITREITEETNLKPRESDFVHLGEVDVISDSNLEEVSINSQVFRYVLDHGVYVESREGQLVSMTSPQIEAELDTMTPGTRECFEKIIGTGVK